MSAKFFQRNNAQRDSAEAIRNCPEPLLVDAGHYVQKRGEVVAERALERFGLA